ncbi:MAG TPA: DUF411 domain-containing protein [Steroidobacteraceae bacterium]|nr:DUF411 domain-containing protein [Steroidobacteraceae bacterium]
MSRRSFKKPTGKRVASAAAQPNIAKELRVVVYSTLFLGAAVGGLIIWDQLFPTPADRLVTVYRVHGCTCVFGWAKALEAEGFVVEVRELQTLMHTRASLHTPTNFHGCHVASYLGYFVEGHVTAPALRRLALDHPDALGVVTQATVTAAAVHESQFRDENSPVLLVARSGQSLPWVQQEG